MRKRIIFTGIGIALASVAFFASGLIPLPSLSQEQKYNQNQSLFSGNVTSSVCTGSAACFTGTVTNIVDGDTIDVRGTRIRLALVNTPELNEEGYAKAKEFTALLCPVGSQVLVDQDDGQLEDRFGRMLAKVTCADNKILNAELLYNEQAGILTEYCAVSEFSSEGWVKGYGCGVAETSVEEDMHCDPAYPGVCIPPPPPDLDCGEISYRKFKVLQPDPHRFDGDKDGIGCET